MLSKLDEQFFFSLASITFISFYRSIRSFAILVLHKMWILQRHLFNNEVNELFTFHCLLWRLVFRRRHCDKRNDFYSHIFPYLKTRSHQRMNAENNYSRWTQIKTERKADNLWRRNDAFFHCQTGKNARKLFALGVFWSWKMNAKIKQKNSSSMEQSRNNATYAIAIAWINWLHLQRGVHTSFDSLCVTYGWKKLSDFKWNEFSTNHRKNWHIELHHNHLWKANIVIYDDWIVFSLIDDEIRVHSLISMYATTQ